MERISRYIVKYNKNMKRGKMKKHLTFLISILIIGTLLVGCSNNEETNMKASDISVSTISENTNKSGTSTSDGNTQNLEYKEKFLKSKEGHDFQVVSWKFTKAYLSRDIHTMKLYLLDPESKDNSYNKENMFDDIEFLILNLNPKDIREDTVNAEYEFGLKGKDTLQYLYLEMKKVNNEWKVKYYGLEQ
jgi:hypothetical protein